MYKVCAARRPQNYGQVSLDVFDFLYFETKTCILKQIAVISHVSTTVRVTFFGRIIEIIKWPNVGLSLILVFSTMKRDNSTILVKCGV